MWPIGIAIAALGALVALGGSKSARDRASADGYKRRDDELKAADKAKSDREAELELARKEGAKSERRRWMDARKLAANGDDGDDGDDDTGGSK